MKNKAQKYPLNLLKIKLELCECVCVFSFVDYLYYLCIVDFFIFTLMFTL